MQLLCKLIKHRKMELSNVRVADIVTMKPEAASLLEKYNVDFCCRGKMKLSEQVTDKDVLIEITRELSKLFDKSDKTTGQFYKMPLTDLIDFIVTQHHAYTKKSLVTILYHLEKVALKHGERFPYMIEVRNLWKDLQREMEQHMLKEEVILFPRIAKMEESLKSGIHGEGYTVVSTIQSMEHEHETAGSIMDEIKLLTSHYTAPAGACTTFMLVLNELHLFEADLHKHVHLENNILFPKAQMLEKDLKKGSASA